MIGTLLHLTKPVWGTGKLVVLDSGFCVLQGLVELKKKGVYAHALIKKEGNGQSMYQEMISLHISQRERLGKQMPSVEN